MLKGWFFNFVYLLALLVCSPVLFYRAAVQGKYREGWKQKFFGRIPKRNAVLGNQCEWPATKVIWIHAVSVGEVLILRNFLKQIKESQPNWHCVISTTSKTGMDTARKNFSDDYRVFYCPLDFTWAVSKAMQRLRPDVLILVEQELWPNLIAAAKKRDAKVAVVNGRFSEKGYKHTLWLRPFLRSMFRQLDLVAVQSETYAGWFRRLGTSSNAIRVTGSMKFDGACTDASNPATLKLWQDAGFDEDDVVFLAGSTQAPEETMAVECFEHLSREFPRLRLVIVPRHPERFEEVAAMLNSKGGFWERRSHWKDSSPQKTERPRILLVDTVGELSAWWGTAAIAFVGGSIGKRGGQNMIEPAAYGAAVSFGPNTKNFQSVTDLMLQEEVAQVVNDQLEMEQFVRRCLEQPDFAGEMGNKAKELTKRQLGATRRTLEYLDSLFQKEDDGDSGIDKITTSILAQ
ncbi:3-deoxy-D-manno-octulosonic acid transferase [Planctomycetales bacterium]|nr:3-deoxy-D-manno-octulosonic acid transferase [Planctomycetales bacterium]